MNQGFLGSLMLLKVKLDADEQATEYKTIGGLRTTRFLLNNNLVDASSKDSGKWRKLLANSGISSVSITASGIFTDSKAEEAIAYKAFLNHSIDAILLFENGDQLKGEFIISTYERSGNFGEEEIYNLTFESSSEITFQKNSDINLAIASP